MTRSLALACAIALPAAAGCLSGMFQAPQGEGAGYKRIVGPPPALVTSGLETGLAEAGVAVVVKREGGETRLVGRTRAGQVICVSVRPVQVEGKGKTSVSVSWGGPPDEQLWETIERVLAACVEAENDPPK
jgi:hypothetical protein